MYNAVTKVSAILVLSIAVAACGPTQHEKDGAALLAEANTAIDNRQFAHAAELIDSLNAAYHDLTDLRRQSNLLKARAIEGMTLDSIVVADERLAQATVARDSMIHVMRHIEPAAEGMDGYYVPSSNYRKGALASSTMLEGRVDDNGYFFLVANLQGKKIGLNAVKIGDSPLTTAVSAERLISVEGSELISINQEEAAETMQWLETHPDAKTFTMSGTKGESRHTLTGRQVSELLTAWRFANVQQEFRAASIRREKLERALATARNQQANLLPETEDTAK